MRIFSWFMDGVLPPNCSRSHARSTTREMLVSAKAFRETFKDQNPDDILCGRFALNARPEWQAVGSSRFRYEKTGEVIDLATSTSLSDLIQAVVGTEVRFRLIETKHNPYDTHDLVLLARQEARETFHKYAFNGNGIQKSATNGNGTHELATNGNGTPEYAANGNGAHHPEPNGNGSHHPQPALTSLAAATPLSAEANT